MDIKSDENQSIPKILLTIEEALENQRKIHEKFMNDNSLKTSHDWYTLTNIYKNIADPDGWRQESNPAYFWHTELISFSDYFRRLNQCTQRTAAHPRFLEPIYPFEQDLVAWESYRDKMLGGMGIL